MARRGPSPDSGPPPWGSVHPLLDLHGLTADEALLRAERWLRDRRAEGARTVVLVTGRGNRSPGPPVLRVEIEHLLEGLKATVVASFAPAEGGGAFRVELRRPPTSSTPAREAEARALARDYDPALRRRAEEALWELGIAPTPALVRAEIERIVREEGEG